VQTTPARQHSHFLPELPFGIVRPSSATYKQCLGANIFSPSTHFKLLTQLNMNVSLLEIICTEVETPDHSSVPEISGPSLDNLSDPMSDQ
jgi:hypothetical protein